MGLGPGGPRSEVLRAAERTDGIAWSDGSVRTPSGSGCRPGDAERGPAWVGRHAAGQVPGDLGGPWALRPRGVDDGRGAQCPDPPGGPARGAPETAELAEAGQELPAVVDPSTPGRFAVTWAVVAVVGGSERTITASQWNDPERAWDPGPDSTHERALARWLTERDHRPGDLAGTQEPSLLARLAERGWGQ